MNFLDFWEAAESSWFCSSPVWTHSSKAGLPGRVVCSQSLLTEKKWKSKFDFRTSTKHSWFLKLSPLLSETPGNIPTGSPVVSTSHWKDTARVSQVTVPTPNHIHERDFLQETYPWAKDSALGAECRLHFLHFPLLQFKYISEGRKMNFTAQGPNVKIPYSEDIVLSLQYWATSSWVSTASFTHSVILTPHCFWFLQLNTFNLFNNHQIKPALKTQ